MRFLIQITAALVLFLFVLWALAYIALGVGMLGKLESSSKKLRPDLGETSLSIRLQKNNSNLNSDWFETSSDGQKQILFGDLHVHSTFSYDAFSLSMPALHGDGSHPPSDACDFARYCSGIDFWAITDHAEWLLPRHWDDTVETIRQCNSLAGDQENPDVVAFLGWEWTQIGRTPLDHYGHRNVVLAGIDDGSIPGRPVGATGEFVISPPTGNQRILMNLLARDKRTLDFSRYVEALVNVPVCPEGLPINALPEGCLDKVATPGELFARLREWQLDALVIPHGTTWGIYSPPGEDWSFQLNATDHDPYYQPIMEIFSGHGNTERYFDFRAVDYDADGNPVCPPATDEYLPSCVQAGKIIARRCLDQGFGQDECERRAAEARVNYVRAGAGGHLTVPGVDHVNEWKDSGQCRDCFLPASQYRTKGSAQYILSLNNKNNPPDRQRFEFGFIGSSDVHSSRPGTGYKEFDLVGMTESRHLGGLWISRATEKKHPYSVPLPEDTPTGNLREAERLSPFFITGGLAAVHASGRDRKSIWRALRQREVYATSGPRIMLWFDLLNSKDEVISPMGGKVVAEESPRFRIRAAGSLEQKPGCDNLTHFVLDEERVRNLCRGECYNPDEQRRAITRLEVIRITPAKQVDENPSDLITDPWLVIPCDENMGFCEATIEDSEFLSANRDAAYYVRAIEEPSEAVNGANLGCEYNEKGECVRMENCAHKFHQQFAEGLPTDGNCLATVEERAWSSPIYVNHPGHFSQ